MGTSERRGRSPAPASAVTDNAPHILLSSRGAHLSQPT